VNNLTGTPLDVVLQTAKIRQYPRGQIVLYEGENPSDMYIIKSGAVKIYDIEEDGNEKILHILKSPAVFPEVFFFGRDGQTNTFYTTVADSEVYVIPRTDLETRLEQDSPLAMYCMRWFAQEVMEMLARMSSLQKTSTRNKLIAVLKYLGRRHAIEQRNGWWRVSFPVSHQMLADMVGVTRESTTMVMRDLHKEGFVRTPRLSILDIRLRIIP